MLKLIEPDKKYRFSYLEAVEEGFIAGGHNPPVSKEEKYIIEFEFDRWIERTNDLSVPVILPDGREAPKVRQSDFWLIDNEEFIGRISVRHALTPFLEKVGGHVGYGVRPNQRRKGFGTKMLAMTLPKARKIGLERLLITCLDTNVGSAKIIEANGGVFENLIKVNFTGEDEVFRRYWINLL